MSHKGVDLKGLSSYLRGYGCKNRDGLVIIAEYRGWAALARREVDRRMEKILESLPELEVIAIANGEIDLNELASEVMADLDLE
ncbi:hypothetical protein [Achromobacter xylosoxidans]|uniref:hypothetical protein n=1 Tax=Alcaligenes xylosoxydans xylosoxydans TaxID=85698 RepID=UPI0028A7DA5C|nr:MULTISPECIES: hypothetical protein [Achromobacter]WOB74343.1 hypothetical protein PZA07_02350 [Achromobacter xylosoxidans]